MMNKITKAIFAIVLFIGVCYWFVGKENYKSHPIHFQFQSDEIAGVLNLPKDRYKKEDYMPLVLFVHGDGEMGKSAYGYYYPIWSELAKRGIASMSGRY